MKFILYLKLTLLCLFVNSFIFSDENEFFVEIASQNQKKVVKIYGGTIGTESGYASGILISGDGKILTAIGMFLSSDRLRVTLSDGVSYRAQVLKRDRQKQLALIQIDSITPDFFDLNQSEKVDKGDWVLAIANPFKVADGIEALSVNLGIVSLTTELEVKRRSRDVEFEGDAIIIDAITSNPGSQGGALLNSHGSLIGMIGKVLEYKGTNTKINYGVPAETLKRFVFEDIALHEKKDVVYIGLHLFEVNGRKAPAFIDRVDLGSPAFFAGLQKDDLIVSLGDKKTANCDDYYKALENAKVGEKIQILFKRKEDFYKLFLTPKKIEINDLDVKTEDED